MNLTTSAEKAIKVLSSTLLSGQVNAMLSHFETYNFLTRNKNNQLEFDFHSTNLKKSLKDEWVFTNSDMSDHPTFSFQSLRDRENFQRAFTSVKNLVTVLPFSLIEITCNKLNYGETPFMQPIDIAGSQFQPREETILRKHTFCPPMNASEVFYKLQRERKIWWRKFSAMPSRFHTSEICTNEKTNDQFVEIKAEFPWGIETVEVIMYKSGNLDHDAGNAFEIKHLGKKCLPRVVTCETSVERGAFTYLCDSFEKLNEDGVGDMLRFSKKLAPYKVAFLGSKAQGLKRNLNDLATLLAKKIHQCGINVLMVPDMFTTNLDAQFIRNDALGIPYTIMLNEQTLKDGIIRLRNRDTTLQEESHVSLIVPYIQKLMGS